ncbi:MAG: hypothetical protein KTR32_20110, partial [Granulosicoccus sp.]|nr:hypothetical protein [Granulosicoccus sp.]
MITAYRPWQQKRAVDKGSYRFRALRTGSVCLVPLIFSAACATNPAVIDTTPIPQQPGVSAEAITPRIASDLALLENTDPLDRAHLQLIATNLVSTLVQVPGMQTSSRTLQISAPTTAFGHAVVRALEDASYGL